METVRIKIVAVKPCTIIFWVSYLRFSHFSSQDFCANSVEGVRFNDAFVR